MEHRRVVENIDSELNEFLVSAPKKFNENEKIKKFQLSNGDCIHCVFWNYHFFISGTDIVKILIYRYQKSNHPIFNLKKFEEGIFSDLRNLKPGIDAILEEPRSELLSFLYKNGCIRTQKKQKVFYWYSVPHDILYSDALERDLRRESQNNLFQSKDQKSARESNYFNIGRERGRKNRKAGFLNRKSSPSLTKKHYSLKNALFGNSEDELFGFNNKVLSRSQMNDKDDDIMNDSDFSNIILNRKNSSSISSNNKRTSSLYSTANPYLNFQQNNSFGGFGGNFDLNIMEDPHISQIIQKTNLSAQNRKKEQNLINSRNYSSFNRKKDPKVKKDMNYYQLEDHELE